MYKKVSGVILASLTFVIGICGVAFYFTSGSETQRWSISNITKVSEEVESYAVYSAVVNEVFAEEMARGDKKPRGLVISDRTSSYPNSQTLGIGWIEEQVQDRKKYYPSVSEDTLTDFYLKTASPIKLESKLDLAAPYTLIDENELERIDEEVQFFTKYSAGGMIKFSRVGFNSSRNQAFVEVEFLYCPLCGFGDKILLEKEFGIWIVKERFGGWIS